ncbi:MAG: virulence factor [Hyphomicrobiaceae bacterium]|nr:virulence factor [Hyphomicrobiaceae bacterium]
MAERIILYWRDIPAQVIVRKGRATEKRELPECFIQAIDACAMRVGARGSEAYLEQWRRGAAQPCSDDLAAEADRAVAELVDAYDEPRLKALADGGGFDRAAAPS